jgi:8-hydroxy-5-deazaflavin:NADPH oxidoreductase
MPSAEADRPTLGFIGGTGPEGRGLALRFASAGYSIVLGSRSAERAESAAKEIAEAAPHSNIEGRSNDMAAAQADVVVLTIPYAGLQDTLPPLRAPLSGKIVVSAVAPVEFQEGRPVALRPEAGSAAQEVAVLLPDSRVVSAFQTVDAHQLGDLANTPDTDVIVCSDDQEARREVVRLANALGGVRGLSGGRLTASRYVEEITALLITLNRIYKSHSGVRFTGIDR